MKKGPQLTCLVAIHFLIQGCTRAATSESAKIQIQLPTESSVLDSKVLAKTGGLADPISIDGVNCYVVFIGGPDSELQANTCRLGKANAPDTEASTTSEFKFGIWSGGVAAGKEISLEVPSGMDRVIHLVGLKASTLDMCRDFKAYGFPDKTQISNPFKLGTTGRVNLKPGETTQVAVEMKFDTEQSLIGCRGPDSPGGGQGDGDGDGEQGPYMRIEGLGRYDYNSNRDLVTVGRCYPIRPAMFVNQGSPYIDPAMSVIQIATGGVSAGRFYSDVNCSAEISSMTIEAASSKSATTYYFKATAASSNQPISGLVLTGNSASISTSDQTLDLGFPKLVIQGPNRVVAGLCFRYNVVSQYFEGGDFQAPVSGTNITLGAGAGFAIKTASDCTGGNTVNIAQAMSTAQFYAKLTAAQTADIGLNITAPGYASVPFVLENAGGGNHYDSLVLKFENDVVKRGECNRATLQMVNFDGGAIKAKSPIPIKIKSPQGSGLFYVDSNCSSPIVDEVTIPTDESYTEVWFNAFGLPDTFLTAGRLPIFVDGGAHKLKGIAAGVPSVILVMVIDTDSYSFVNIEPPSFNDADIVGDHEFTDAGGGYKNIILRSNYGPSFVDVECSFSANTGFSSCSGAEVDRTMVPYIYKWSQSNAVSGTTRYIRFVYSSWYTRSIAISPATLYGGNFKVLPCSQIAPAGVGQPLTSIPTVGPVVCLPPNSTFLKTTTNGYSLNSAVTSLIGHSSRTSGINGSLYLGNLINVTGFTLAASDYAIANLKLDGIPSTTNGIFISNLTPFGTNLVRINNVVIEDTVPAVSGIGISLSSLSSPSISVVIRKSKISMVATLGNGIYGSNIQNVIIQDSEISSVNPNPGSHAIAVVNSSGTGDNIKVLRSVVTSNGGAALSIINSGASVGQGFEVKNSRFLKGGAAGGNSLVYVTGKINSGTFENNMVMSQVGTLNSNLVNLDGTSFPQTLSFKGNVLVQGAATSGLAITGTSSITLNEFSKNSFSLIGATNNFSGAISVAAVATLFVNTTIPFGEQPAGGNLICSNAPGVGFVPATLMSGIESGPFTLSAISNAVNAMNANTGRCQQ
jgi:hypothetical protein